eukprot:Pgem_evm1s16447
MSDLVKYSQIMKGRFEVTTALYMLEAKEKRVAFGVFAFMFAIVLYYAYNLSSIMVTLFMIIGLLYAINDSTNYKNIKSNELLCTDFGMLPEQITDNK